MFLSSSAPRSLKTAQPPLTLELFSPGLLLLRLREKLRSRSLLRAPLGLSLLDGLLLRWVLFTPLRTSEGPPRSENGRPGVPETEAVRGEIERRGGE